MQRIMDRVTQQHLADPEAYLERCKNVLMQMEWENNPPSDGEILENWKSTMKGLKALQDRGKRGV